MEGLVELPSVSALAAGEGVGVLESESEVGEGVGGKVKVLLEHIDLQGGCCCCCCSH